MLITALEKRKGEGYALFVEGEYALTLNQETLVTEGLRAGQEITPERLTDLRRKADLRRAREHALYLLEKRSYSREELIRKLSRTAGPEAAHAVADRMEELGLIDDDAYARLLADHLWRYKGYGEGRIRQEMARRGLDRERIGRELERLREENPPDDVAEKLCAIISRKYARYLNDEKGINKTVQALLRLGYSYEDIRRALRHVRDREEDNYAD